MARLVLVVAAGLACAACNRESTAPRTLPGVTITVTPAGLTLAIGASASLVATVQDLEGHPLMGREVKWSSSAPEIVAVAPTGVVTALDVGSASIGAYSEQGVGFARVVVQVNFRVPLRRWLVMTEMGTPTLACPGGEGGLRSDGSRDCTHAAIGRYSLDFTEPEHLDGSPADPATPNVFAAADGIIADTCLQPPTEVTCGSNGPFVQVRHRGGFLTVYAHLDPTSVTLRRKSTVTQGQPLGTMGAGQADLAPWLHFEMHFEKQGAGAASVLDAVEIDGRKFKDYKVGG
ncbi:MAG TPA: peptidoglycan DD-metalloendopeptidase family protein [Gemmatimonadales bacterium]|jgi:hypothetical protein